MTKTGCVDEVISTDGIFTRTCSVSTVAGSAGPVSVTIKRDANAPTTTATLTPTPVGEWYSPRTVTLAAADGSGSGVATTEYALDGGPWTVYASPFSVSTFGPHTLLVRSTDVAGNVEAVRTIAWGSDFTAAQQLAALSQLVGTLGLDRHLTAELRLPLAVARALVGYPKLSCAAVNAFLGKVMDEVTERGSDLSVGEARMLLSANQILLTLGCQAAGSNRHAVENDLLSLVETIKGYGLHRSASADLKEGVRDVGLRVIAGSSLACREIGDLRRTINHYDGRKKGLTHAQADELRADVAAVASQLGCP